MRGWRPNSYLLESTQPHSPSAHGWSSNSPILLSGKLCSTQHTSPANRGVSTLAAIWCVPFHRIKCVHVACIDWFLVAVRLLKTSPGWRRKNNQQKPQETATYKDPRESSGVIHAEVAPGKSPEFLLCAHCARSRPHPHASRNVFKKQRQSITQARKSVHANYPAAGPQGPPR